MHIASPCHETWNAMTPVPGGRHCAACDHPVVDLTALAPDVRRARLAEIASTVAGGTRVCVRGRVDRDGALAGTRRLLTGGMAALLAMSLAGSLGHAAEAGQTTAPTTTVPIPAGGPMTQGRMKIGEATTPLPTPPEPKVEPQPKVEPEPKTEPTVPKDGPVPPRAVMGLICVPPPKLQPAVPPVTPAPAH